MLHVSNRDLLHVPLESHPPFFIRPGKQYEKRPYQLCECVMQRMTTVQLLLLYIGLTHIDV